MRLGGIATSLGSQTSGSETAPTREKKLDMSTYNARQEEPQNPKMSLAFFFLCYPDLDGK